MRQIRAVLLVVVAIIAAVVLGRGTRSIAASSRGQKGQQTPAARVVDLKAADGIVLKATYFAAAKPGPGVLLLHQGNRTRQSWDDLAGQVAAAGIHTLTLDMRGYGESGGRHQGWPREDKPVKKIWAGDIDTALPFTQPCRGAGQAAGGIRQQHDAMLLSLEILFSEPLPRGRLLAQAPAFDFIFV
jgi:pimeloyl-ACP methyl ester carboxylesterase